MEKRVTLTLPLSQASILARAAAEMANNKSDKGMDGRIIRSEYRNAARAVFSVIR